MPTGRLYSKGQVDAPSANCLAPDASPCWVSHGSPGLLCPPPAPNTLRRCLRGEVFCILNPSLSCALRTFCSHVPGAADPERPGAPISMWQRAFSLPWSLARHLHAIGGVKGWTGEPQRDASANRDLGVVLPFKLVINS